MRKATGSRNDWRGIAGVCGLLLLAGALAPDRASAGWPGGGIVFKLGWPPVSFTRWSSGEDPGEIGGLVEASLTRDAWESSAPLVRGVATGDKREELEALLGTESYEVELSTGGSGTIRVANGYIDAISTPRRMEFGYVVNHLVIRKWSVRFDEEGHVIETDVFPDGRNDELLAEKRPDRGDLEEPPVSAFGLDYHLGRVRGYPFLSKTGWERAEGPLRKIRIGDTRLSVELALDGRYYLYGIKAWFMANGYLPDASAYNAGKDQETLAFGWDIAGEPHVRARVALEGERRQGRWDAAAATLEEALNLNPRSYALAFTLGDTYLRMRRFDEARGSFDLAVSVAPHLEAARVERFGLLIALGDTTAARVQLEADSRFLTPRTIASLRARLALYARDFSTAPFLPPLICF